MQRHLEARRKGSCLQKQDVIPAGLPHGFYQRTGLPCLASQVPATVAWFDGKVHMCHLTIISTELCCQWQERETVGRAAGGKQCTHFQFSHAGEQKERDDEVACSALWKGISFSIIHVFALCKVSGVPVCTPQHPTYVNIDQLNIQKCYVIEQLIRTADNCWVLHPTHQPNSGKPQYVACGPWEWF